MNSRNDADTISLPRHLRNRILERLGLANPLRATPTALVTLYKAWCRNVPFDNATLLTQTSSIDQRHLVSTKRFFEDWLREGTGGLCVPTALAWQALLASFNYNARCVLGAIDHDGRPNHLTVVVSFSKVEYVVDTVNLCEQPVLLADGQVSAPCQAHAVAVERSGAYWRLRYQTAAQRWDQSCLLFPDNVSYANAKDLYFRSLATPRFRSLNRKLYTRRNTPEGILVVLGIVVKRVRHDGTVTCSSGEDLKRVLTEEIGYSSGLARKLIERNAPK
jgi:arylamine N-acetyltransferase